MRVVFAVDHGTSGVKVSLVNEQGEILAVESENLATDYGDDGRAEQDPEGWWAALRKAGARAVARGVVPAADIAAVCVSSTFSSTVAVGQDGRSLMPCITWMDTRGGKYVRAVMKGWPSFLGYGVPTVLNWIRLTGGAPSLSGKDDLGHALLVKHEHPEVYRDTACFLPSKDFFNLRLTGRAVASRESVTLFWLTDSRDIHDLKFHPGLVKKTGLDPAKLPKLIGATDIVGPLLPAVAAELGLAPGTPVVCGTPDHQAAGVGAGSVADFETHLYIGTSSWLQCTVPFKKTDVLHSIASLPTCIPGKYYCANEQDLAGGCLTFLMDNVMRIPQLPGGANDVGFDMLDMLVRGVPAGSGGVLFAPWLNGERTPVDDETIRGAFFNIGKTTTLAHMSRAVMEGVALNTRWSLTYVEKFLGRRLPHINFVGGGALSDTWCQIFADVLQREIRRVKNPRQANARGAAMVAAVGLGWFGWDEVARRAPIERTFTPSQATRATYDKAYAAFTAYYHATAKLHRALNGHV
jgi:xylulokinase